jgi:hypothetical protein
MTDDLEAIVTIEVLSRHFPGGTEENHKNLRIAGITAEICIEHHGHTGLEGYL